MKHIFTLSLLFMVIVGYSQDSLQWVEKLPSDVRVFRKPTYFSTPNNKFPGSNVQIVGYSNDFLKVKMDDGSEGYVLSDFVPNGNRYEQILIHRMAEDVVAKKGLYFASIEVYQRNMSDGVDVRIVMGYNGNKVIKYIHIFINPYNGVGDSVSDQITGQKTIKYTLTGPVDFLKPSELIAEQLFYSSTAVCVQINKVEIEYMDGTKEIYIRDLPQLFLPSMVNDCSY